MWVLERSRGDGITVKSRLCAKRTFFEHLGMNPEKLRERAVHTDTKLLVMEWMLGKGCVLGCVWNWTWMDRVLLRGNEYNSTALQSSPVQSLWIMIHPSLLMQYQKTYSTPATVLRTSGYMWKLLLLITGSRHWCIYPCHRSTRLKTANDMPRPFQRNLGYPLSQSRLGCNHACLDSPEAWLEWSVPWFCQRPAKTCKPLCLDPHYS